MFKFKSKLLTNVLLLFVFALIVVYYVVESGRLGKIDKNYVKKDKGDYNIWLILTKINDYSPLRYKFRNLIANLLNVSSVPLNFHIVVDNKSAIIAKHELDTVPNPNVQFTYKFYKIEECVAKIDDIVNVMSSHFSSEPGTYYSGALFYISLGLYRIAPKTQQRAILLDCDLLFKKDVLLLFKEFEKFKYTALFGLAPELTPVYRHILHSYKLKHKTTFGEYYNTENITSHNHPHGFPGYNSGVVLLNFAEIRKSEAFVRVISNETVHKLTEKYRFRGHLGDQDFYTLIGYEYPHLIQTLNCGFNRQLCTWWRDHGYSGIFEKYFACNHSIVVLHGNCNTKISN